MKVGELKRVIAALDDDMLVVVPGSDHSYDVAYTALQKAEVERNRSGRIDNMTEYYEGHGRYSDTVTVETVLVVGR